MFRLTWEEASAIRSQNVTLNGADSAARSQNVISTRGSNIKYRPRVFTEQGVAMLSAVLRSKRAIAISIVIIKAFVRMRELGKHDKKIRDVYAVLQHLLKEPEKPKEQMGFQP